MQNKRTVGITSSEYVSKVVDLLPSNEERQSIVYWLIKSYGITNQAKIIPIQRASHRDLLLFHATEYVDALLNSREDVDEVVEQFEELKKLRGYNIFADNRKIIIGSEEQTKVVNDDVINLDKYGLLYDCPVFPFMRDYVGLVAGSTISTAKYLILEHKEGRSSVGINWYGGRHHAKKSSASGFCYVNDIVLGINVLRTHFPKVFYLDLDLHHGDGVEKAYKFSSKVLTCSIHMFDIGFFPGTGSITDKKMVNIPTKKGLNDQSFQYIVENAIKPIIEDFGPSAMVIQLGADGLGTDKAKEWNLTIKGYTSAVHKLIYEITVDQSFIPTLLLGGGGYNHKDTARLWTNVTQMAVDPSKALDDDIPDSPVVEQFYEDRYKFWNQENSNPRKVKDYNENLSTTVEKILSDYGIS